MFPEGFFRKHTAKDNFRKTYILPLKGLRADTDTRFWDFSRFISHQVFQDLLLPV